MPSLHRIGQLPIHSAWPAGREFFSKLDMNGDNKVSVEDVKALMRQRKLPESYASKFISAARGNRWWSNSIRCQPTCLLACIICMHAHCMYACGRLPSCKPGFQQ